MPERRLWLAPGEMTAVRELLRRIRSEVGAELLQASLFGSRARGTARPDSDVDVLLLFQRLPPDREPQASEAERVAEEVARKRGVPLSVWSVSLRDLEVGRRTPMLVDALADGLPLWSRGAVLGPLPFTRSDARFCTRRLLERVEEGSQEVAEALAEGGGERAARRMRDDVVRLCIALLLLQGRTRPRRGEAPARLLEGEAREWPREVRTLLGWAAHSFGASGRDEEGWVPPPPGGFKSACRRVEWLRGEVARRRR